MKPFLITITLVFINWFYVEAQKPPLKFGEVSMEVLKMKRYEKDTSASAVVLADFGISTITYDQKKGFFLKFERIRRVKIFSKEGYEWGNFSILLYKEGATDEDVNSIKAITYNLENGQIIETKLKNESIYREEMDKNLTNVKFALPNVKVGSIIDITYKVNSPFLFNFQDWDFQTTIPTVWSEYRVHIPEYFNYKKFMQGYLGVSINESETLNRSFSLEFRESDLNVGKSSVEYEKINYLEDYTRWVVQEAPAFHVEPHMTTYRDFVSRIKFELNVIRIPNQAPKSFNTSWDDLNHDFLADNYFGGVLNGSGFLKEHVDKAIGGQNEAKSKIAAIYYYLKELVGWNGQYRKYSSEDLKKVIDNRKGSSAEINLILVSMLQKAGFGSSPVLISTRDHGFVRKDSPVSSQFNYVIAAVELDGGYWLLDATDRSLPMNILPERCLNGDGFLIAEEKSGWIKINPVKSKYFVKSDLTVGVEGELNGKMQFTHEGYYAQRIRKRFSEEGKEEYLNSITSERNWKISSSTIENMEKLHEPVKEAYEIVISDQIQANVDHIYLNPLLTNRITKNPFQAEIREYPVDFGSPEESLFMTRITIPAGWVVEEMPKPKIFILPGNAAKYIYSTTLMGNTISLTSQLVINKPLFNQDEYLALRDFYGQVVAKQAELVVLKKQ